MTRAVKRVEDELALAQLGQVRADLARVRSLPDLKAIRDKAEAIAAYSKQQRYSLEIQNNAAEIRLQAERRLGELLRELPKDRGGRPKEQTPDTVSGVSLKPPTLEELGISQKQSSRWQQEAALPQEAFDIYVQDARTMGEELTSAAVLRLAKAHLPTPTPREKRWCIEDDVDALFDLWGRLWPHWQTADDKARMAGTLRGLLVQLEGAPDADG